MTYRKVCPPEKLSHVPEMLRILPSMGERMSRGPLGLVRKMEVPLHMSRAHSLGAGPGSHHGAPSGTLPIGARERWWRSCRHPPRPFSPGAAGTVSEAAKPKLLWPDSPSEVP